MNIYIYIFCQLYRNALWQVKKTYVFYTKERHTLIKGREEGEREVRVSLARIILSSLYKFILVRLRRKLCSLEYVSKINQYWTVRRKVSWSKRKVILQKRRRAIQCSCKNLSDFDLHVHLICRFFMENNEHTIFKWRQSCQLLWATNISEAVLKIHESTELAPAHQKP